MWKREWVWDACVLLGLGAIVASAALTSVTLGLLVGGVVLLLVAVIGAVKAAITAVKETRDGPAR